MNHLLAVRESLQIASSGRPVSLIAVSKLQPIESIKEAYSLGQRDFGENYVQELVGKAAALKEICPEIRWHFIGALQSNKIGQLIKICGLRAIQTVDSLSKFEKIIKATQGQVHPIELFLQVNVSGEDNKHGLKTVEEIIDIYQKYKQLNPQNCQLIGLMTIGEVEAAERDFSRMIQLRRQVQEKVCWDDCKISMGMSADYELAARMGSDVVRVGSAIFGERK